MIHLEVDLYDQKAGLNYVNNEKGGVWDFEDL